MSRRLLLEIILLGLIFGCSYSSGWKSGENTMVSQQPRDDALLNNNNIIHLFIDLGPLSKHEESSNAFIYGFRNNLWNPSRILTTTSRDSADYILEFNDMTGGSDYNAPSAGFFLTLGLIPERIKYSYVFNMDFKDAKSEDIICTFHAECKRTMVRHLLLLPIGIFTSTPPVTELRECHGKNIAKEFNKIFE